MITRSALLATETRLGAVTASEKSTRAPRPRRTTVVTLWRVYPGCAATTVCRPGPAPELEAPRAGRPDARSGIHVAEPSRRAPGGCFHRARSPRSDPRARSPPARRRPQNRSQGVSARRTAAAIRPRRFQLRTPIPRAPRLRRRRAECRATTYGSFAAVPAHARVLVSDARSGRQHAPRLPTTKGETVITVPPRASRRVTAATRRHRYVVSGWELRL